MKESASVPRLVASIERLLVDRVGGADVLEQVASMVDHARVAVNREPASVSRSAAQLELLALRADLEGRLRAARASGAGSPDDDSNVNDK